MDWKCRRERMNRAREKRVRFFKVFLKYLVAVPEKDTLPQISELMNDFYVRRIGGLIILMR